jgi:hypothetical protein
MSLLAVVAGICYGAFHLGVRAVERGEVAVVTAQRLRVATDVLIRQVKSTAIHPALVDGDTYPYFYGSPTTMSFVTDAGQLSGGGRARVTYHYEADPPRLVLEESPFVDAESLGQGTPEAAEARSAVLLDGFRTMTFQYLLDDGADSEWKNSWDFLQEEILPAAVRILVEGLPGLEEDVWGQEIPVMSATYGDAGGELGEESDLQDCESADALLPSGEPASGTDDAGADEADEVDEDADDEEGE